MLCLFTNGMLLHVLGNFSITKLHRKILLHFKRSSKPYNLFNQLYNIILICSPFFQIRKIPRIVVCRDFCRFLIRNVINYVSYDHKCNTLFISEFVLWKPHRKWCFCRIRVNVINAMHLGIIKNTTRLHCTPTMQSMI